jgi:adenine deaminase
MKVGLLREGEPADFILVKDLTNFGVLQTYINGQLVAENGITKIVAAASTAINNFSCDKKEPADFFSDPATNIAIEALDGQLITNKFPFHPRSENGNAVSDPDNDILKIVVVNRYKNAPVATAFIKNIGLSRGAFASSVAHDSHNLVAVGTDDESICSAVNLIISNKGGISFVDNDTELIVPLPVGGLMSTEDGYHVARQYSHIDQAVKKAGSTLASPFMTVSFMALLVIPHLKLSDLGLFDGDKFGFVK